MPYGETQLEVATALNADVVGYSRLMADDLAATSEAMDVARAVVTRSIDDVGGRLINFVGDNFMALFSDSVAAVQAAIQIASDLENRNEEVETQRQLRFRMGMDRGMVSDVGGRFEGEALNVAARIQALALAGGLSVSGAVYRDLDEPSLRFRPEGTKRLKNIPEPVEVFAFSDLPIDRSLNTSAPLLDLELPTLAVLPIHTEDVDDQVASGAAMIRSDIVHTLSGVPELTIVDAQTHGEGAEMPAARYMLETGVHQFGENLRIYATLFDVTTMNVVKSHKLTTQTSRILEAADDLSRAVKKAIEIELVVGAPAGLYAELEDPEAIENVYLGWYHLRTDTEEGWHRARDLFGRVSDSHPDLPYGWVLSGFTNWIGAANGWAEPEGALELAREQAKIGADTGDLTGMAGAVEAAVLMSMGRVEEAMNVMAAVEITRPTCDVTYGLEGSLKRYLGEWEEAVDLLDTAMRLTGINKPWYPTVKACSLFVGNRVDQASAVAESVLEYQPNNLEALLVLAAAQVELGLQRRASATADRIRASHPNLNIAEWLKRNPYQDAETVNRLTEDFMAIDLIPEPS